MVPNPRVSMGVLLLSLVIHGGAFGVLWMQKARPQVLTHREPIHLMLGHSQGPLGQKPWDQTLVSNPALTLAARRLRKKSLHPDTPSSTSGEVKAEAEPVMDPSSPTPAVMDPDGQSNKKHQEELHDGGSSDGSDQPHTGQETRAALAPVYLDERGEGGSLGAYESILLQYIREHEFYPSGARLRRMEGTVTIYLAIQASGVLDRVAIQDSSGYELLDQAALNMVEDASPFPPPQSYGLGDRQYLLPVIFSLSSRQQ
jgi:TonB family protein